MIKGLDLAVRRFGTRSGSIWKFIEQHLDIQAVSLLRLTAAGLGGHCGIGIPVDIASVFRRKENETECDECAEFGECVR